MSRLWRNHNEALLTVMVVLICLGALNIFSASFVKAGQEMKDGYYFFKRHLIYVVLGWGVFFWMARINYQRGMRKSALAFWGVCLVLLVLVEFSGMTVNGSKRWLRLGSLTVQPSEFAKLAAVFLTASYLAGKVKYGRQVSLLGSPPLLAVLPLAYLVYRQPDMGTAALIFALPLVMHLVAGIPGKQWLLLGAGGTLGVYALTMAEGYRAERIASWLNPWKHAQDQGYQAVQALLAIGSGGLTGTGPGQGSSKFFYLPEAHTDFAYAVFCQEWGLGGAWLMVLLFALLLVHGARIVRKAPDSYSQMLGLGCLLLVTGQATGNLLMVLGLLPVIGVPLPFISYGGTSLLVNMAAMGLLLNVGRRAAAAAAAPAPPEPDEDPGLQQRLEQRRHLRLLKR